MASPFVVHDPEFLRALGDAPRLDRVVDIDAHEGPVYVADADALYFTSLPTPDWQVAIRRIAVDGDRFPLAVDRVETVVPGSEAPSLPSAATYIPKQKVHEQFRTGGLLLQTPSYKLDAGCRTGPGAVERHDHETDIMHIVHGSATVVTGEDKYLLNEGDVLVIPNGMPHQFVDVTAPFFYLVTKVQS